MVRLRRSLAAAVALACCASSVAGQTYAHCILDKMPGTPNDAVAYAVVQSCMRENRGGMYVIRKGSGRGWFSHGSPQACVMKKARDTTNQKAATVISAACHCLYGENSFDGEMCGYPSLPSQ